MMKPEDTLLAAAAVAVPVGYAWEFWVWPRVEAYRERVAGCRHDFERVGDHWNRTDKCRNCPEQRPVKTHRCPKCREWSDQDEV